MDELKEKILDYVYKFGVFPTKFIYSGHKMGITGGGEIKLKDEIVAHNTLENITVIDGFIRLCGTKLTVQKIKDTKIDGFILAR